MRTTTAFRICVALTIALVLLSISRAAPASLQIEVQPSFAGTPLVFDALTNVTAAGQTISVTRLDLLLSNFTLRHTNGTWVTATNGFANLNGREQRTTFTLPAVPAGDYDRIRFHVGVPERENHANPGTLAADHPLNPNVNGLHWNWQGGYVFLALEGRWGAGSGYSYHIATDPLLATIELPISIAGEAVPTLRLALNVDRILSHPHRISIAEDTASTHSREDDILARQLRENIEQAFSVVRVTRQKSGPNKEPARPIRPLVAANATPYRFSFPSYFPRPAMPLDNPLTEEGVELGRRLFHDTRLSSNNSQSCASCHQSEAAFSDGRRVSPGAEGQPGTRNSMPLLNLAWKNAFFWDGRTATLREQVLQPIENPIEMHETLTNVVKKLDGLQTNRMLFARAFGTAEITADRIALALEQFLLVQVSHDSKFDRSLTGQVELTDEEKRGFELFHTEYDPRRSQFGADCFHCHGGPLFQSQSFANNGLDTEFNDPGRALVTGKPGDQGKFAVPSLRNVGVTAPYMHDGRFATLEEVIEHYSTGVKRSATLDPNLSKHPDGGVPLSAMDKQALVAFLKTLTDERFARKNLVQSAR